jgi:hypothetical protein
VPGIPLVPDVPTLFAVMPVISIVVPLYVYNVIVVVPVLYVPPDIASLIGRYFQAVFGFPDPEYV